MPDDDRDDDKDDNDSDEPEELTELDRHLDRGWNQLGENDLDGARASAEAALALDKGCAEAMTLLGAVAADGREDDQAIKLFRRAIKNDPEAVTPLLYLASLLSAEKEEFAEALKLCDRAIELAEVEDDFIDAVLLKAETQLQAGADEDSVRNTMEELPEVADLGAAFLLRAGRVWLDLEDDVAAEEALTDALEQEGDKNPDAAEIWHLLGMVYEMREDRSAQVKAWLRVRELDLAEDPPAHTLSDEAFEAIAEDALEELPERIRDLLVNVPIVAGDYPSLEIVAEGNDPRMLGFFSGVAYPEKSSVGGMPHVDCVFLYKRNIERVAEDEAEVAKEIRITLLHETGHFFGLSEEELEAMGLG
jgi:predicted Zn-dependent protease with MMP-like domain